MTDYHTSRGVVLLVAVGTLVFVGGMSGQASHGGHATNYTIVPQESPDDRRPGAGNASYVHSVTFDESDDGGGEPNESLSIETMAIRWDGQDTSLKACTSGDIDLLGIDRRNDDPGTSVDVHLSQDEVATRHGRNLTYLTLTETATIRYDVADQLVLVHADCYENPHDPAVTRFYWYVNGTTPDGEGVSLVSEPHHVYNCDCESRSEGIDRLGPPSDQYDPPERTPMPTPTGAAAHSSSPTATVTATPTRETTATVEVTPTVHVDHPATVTAAETPTPDTSGSPTPSRTVSSGETDSTRGSVTTTSGTGFGLLAGLAAVVWVAIAGSRRN